LRHFHDYGGRLKFDDLNTFKELQENLMRFSLSMTAVVEETDTHITRLLHQYASADWLQKPLAIAQYVEFSKIKQDSTIELLQSLSDDLDVLTNIVKNSDQPDQDLLTSIMTVLALREKLQPLVQAVNRGDQPSIIMLDEAARRRSN